MVKKLIQIDDAQWLELNKHKNPAEPFEKVLGRILRIINAHKLWSKIDNETPKKD